MVRLVHPVVVLGKVVVEDEARRHYAGEEVSSTIIRVPNPSVEFSDLTLG
jgi:hypothetical protein